MSRSSNWPLEVSVVLDDRDFAALEEDWEDLYDNAPLATPFQSWAWLYSWWESYGEGHELCLVTVREGGLLVGLLPLMLKRQWRFFGKLLFVGTGASSYKDVLVRKGWESQVSNVASQALKRIDSWLMADLRDLYPEAAAWSMFQWWDRPKTHIQDGNYLIIDVKPWDELLKSVSKRLRNNTRRTLRRAEADGVSRCEITRPEDVERAARRLVTLHREAWRGRYIDPEHLTGRFESFITAAARRMAARGLGSIYEFWRDGEVLISGFMVSGSGFDAAYMAGASEEALQRYQWSSLSFWYEMDIARAHNSACMSVMEGEEPYKLRWAAKRVPRYRMILVQKSAFWFIYTGYRTLRSRAKRNKWIRKAAERYRALTLCLSGTFTVVCSDADPGILLFGIGA